MQRPPGNFEELRSVKGEHRNQYYQRAYTPRGDEEEVTNRDTFRINWRAPGRGGYYYANPDGSHFYSNCPRQDTVQERHHWPNGRGGLELVQLMDLPWVEVGVEDFVWEDQDLDWEEQALWRIENLAPTRRFGHTDHGQIWYLERALAIAEAERANAQAENPEPRAANEDHEEGEQP